MDINTIGKNAKAASRLTAAMETKQKNEILTVCGEALINNADAIIEANKADYEKAKANGMSKPMLDRLMLNKDRIEAMADGLFQIAKLSDPVGEYVSMNTLPNGLIVGQKRVPMGVIGIIYEARPNVTSDAFGLCLKAGSAVILKGGSDAINSNKAVVDILRQAVEKIGVNPDIVTLIEDTSRETTTALMRLNEYVDLLIPRGGAGLISAVVKNSTVPVIETGTGNCHIYVDDTAKIQMALDILINAKTQRIGVCNAAESLLVSERIAPEFLPLAAKALKEKGVEIRGCEKTAEICRGFEIVPATEEDYAKEFLDLIISVKVVKDVNEAIDHIAKYSTGHSEAIVTESYENAQKFLAQVDSAAVYVNASTRFTDGNEFGFGAEIGISTQKLHARGPMGLQALTTTKFVIYGNGQIRP
ncbi:MAG: glutamate-5-semialdehyde dehydrogenase [Clostridiales bacterium]|nr:glutamate-5-semialdehyde dehydrogenase [Clostridiales bacterium]